jgi:hypothetical protein
MGTVSSGNRLRFNAHFADRAIPLFPSNKPHESPGQAAPSIFSTSLFLWKSEEQSFAITPLMHWTAVFINLAVI